MEGAAEDGEIARFPELTGARLPADTARSELPTDGVPIRLAATVMLVDDRPDLHVLALRRTDASTFVAGHTLFPGGAVDDGDLDRRWVDLVVTPKVEPPALVDPLALRLAAVRETIEEVGIALGVERGDRSDELVARRIDLETNRVTLLDLATASIAGGGPKFDLSVLYPVARWVTPMAENKRYDTAFFLALCPSGVEPVVDGREAVHAEWCRPADALARWEAGELTMVSPTVSMFQCLATYSTATEVLAAAVKPGQARQASVLDETSDLVRFEGDVDFEGPGRRLTLGWVWLESGSVA
ncbi:MAG TPA: hypothetical protein DGF10_00610 [Acidimicrobiaceae bacterium]|nr:hypothetical protein [Acidimicrobiaceae bacterium]